MALVAALTLIATIAIPIATSGNGRGCVVQHGGESQLVQQLHGEHEFVFALELHHVVIQVMVQIYDQDLCGPLIAVDGYYGSDTAYAVTCWQQGHGLSVDGVVGPQTWTSYMNALDEYTTTGG